MLDVPPPEARARFAPGFGQRAVLTIDTEEEFDWAAPFARKNTATSHCDAFADFQSLCESIGAHPVWLVDWPIAGNPVAAGVIRDAAQRGRADIGLHLHPWVNPPFEEEVNAANSYAGNLPSELEAAKFLALKDRIEEVFGISPAIYRAGRYGLGPHTAALLAEHGIALDSSVRPLFDYSCDGGPDYRGHPAHPYWIDAERRLLEMPVTTVHAGHLRRFAAPLQRVTSHLPASSTFLARSGLLERIALTPEGVTIEEAKRGIDEGLDQGLPLIVLSLHSPSLVPGNTPYVRSVEDLARLHEWLRAIFGHLASRGILSASVADIIAASSRDLGHDAAS